MERLNQNMPGKGHHHILAQPEIGLRMFSCAFFLLAVLLALPSPAYALDVGGIISNAGNLAISSPVRIFIHVVAYVVGASLIFLGMFKLVKYVDDPARNHPVEPWMYLISGTLLIFFVWFVYQRLVPTLFSGDLKGVGSGGGMAGGSGEGLDARFISFVSNVDGPLRAAITAICWLIGVIMAFNGVVRLTKVSQKGPKGPAGAGTLMTFIVAAIMLSLGNMMEAVSFSVLGGVDFSTSYELVAIPKALGKHGEAAKNAFQAALVFVQLIGWIAFARGWLLIRDIVDGTSKSSMLSGFTHVIGGALAANIGSVLKALQATLGITIIS